MFGRDCSMEDARERMKMLLHSLQDSYLLLESDNEDIVKIHDHVREAAISIASKRGRHVLVMRNDHYMLKIDKLPERLECLKLKIFIIHSNNRLLKVPDSFSKSMDELNIMHLTNLYLTSLPSSIQSLESCRRNASMIVPWRM